MESQKSQPGKVVHITNYYHDASGGVRTNYDSLLREAEKSRRRHVLIVPGEKSEKIKTGEFTSLYKIAARPSPIFDKRYRLMLPNQYLFHGSAIREVLLAEMPDVIEIYDNYALTFIAGMIRKGYFRRLGRPMLVYFTGERFDTIFASFVMAGRAGKWFSRAFMGKYNLAMFDYFIANSPFVAEELFESVSSSSEESVSSRISRWCWTFFRNTLENFRERVAICPRGVDTSLFGPHLRSSERRASILRNLAINERAFVIISSTRLSPEKNVRLLPSIVSWLRDNSQIKFHLVIAGDGPERATLEMECQEKRLDNVTFAGHLPRQRLAELYANADCFIHPNPREPFGNVGLEAMASGISIVVSNSGGVRTYANESNAWLADDSVEGFGRAIIEVATRTSEAEAKRRVALETAAAHSVSAAFDRLFATYDQMYLDFRSASVWATLQPNQRDTIKTEIHRTAG